MKLGETEELIRKFLDSKASSFPESEWTKGKVYASVKEISEAIGKSPRSTHNSLRRLEKMKLVQTYPHRRKNNLLYGPAWLPQMTWEGLTK